MHLHYGREFGEWRYHEGEVDHEIFEIDTISLVRFDLRAQELGLFGTMMYYWRHPDKDYKSGLKRLENDAIIFEMALSAADVGEVDVYVRHLNKDE